MPPFEHVGGSVFRYLDHESYCTHMARASPSSFFAPSESTPRVNMESDFDALADTLFNRMREVLTSGGLFHVRAYARQMIRIDEELTRRFGDGWCWVDLTETRQAIGRLANIEILSPSMPAPSRRPSPPPRSEPRFRPTPGPGAPARLEDPETVFDRTVHEQGSHQQSSHRPTPHSGAPRSPFMQSLDDSIDPGNITFGVDTTEDGRVRLFRSIVLPRWVGGGAGDITAMQNRYIEEGERDAETDFRHSDRAGAHQRTLHSGRYSGNMDYRHGYDQRWERLEQR